MNARAVTNAREVLDTKYQPMTLPHKLSHAERMLAYQWMKAAVGDILCGAHTPEEIDRMCNRELQTLRMEEGVMPSRFRKGV